MLRIPGEGDPVERVRAWLASVFIYTPDGFNPRLMDNEEWPTRAEIEGQFYGTGRIRDDCDGHAFAAVYALADLGVKARVVTCMTEPAAGDDGQVVPRGHMVAETEAGLVLDNRYPDQFMTWDQLERGIGYRRMAMSGFFEFGEVGAWHEAR